MQQSDQLRHEATQSIFCLRVVDAVCNHLSGKGTGIGSPSSVKSGLTRAGDNIRKDVTRVRISDASHFSGFAPDSLTWEGLSEFVLGGRCTWTFHRPNGVVIRAAYFTRAVLEVLYDAVEERKIRALSSESLLSIFRRSLQWPEEDFDKCAKYFCVRLMSQYLHQDPPALPPTSYGPLDRGDWLLFTGPARRLIKNRLISYNAKNTSLFQGFLQGVKRGCYQVSSTLVHTTLEKHSKVLSKTKEPKTIWAEGETGVEQADKKMRSYIRRVVHELYKEEIGPLKLYDPSTSAAYGFSRKNGGQFQGVSEFLNVDQLPRVTHLSGLVEIRPGRLAENRDIPPPDAAEVMQMLTRRYHLEPLNRSLPMESNGLPIPLPTWWERDYDISFYRDILDKPTLLDDMAPPPKEFEAAVQAGFIGPDLLHNKVEVSPVLEPLKVRLVSKGEPLKYWLSQHMQKYLWSGLQKSDVFRLTGRPLMTSDLYDLMGDDLTGKWVSGDYSAATDSVRMGWTIEAFEQVLKVAKPSYDYARICRRVLYGQDLEYGAKYPSDWAAVQASGQLMGSTLSFPILCILNLAAYWMAHEHVHGRTSMKKLPVLVNGDDILFRVPESGAQSPLYQRWLQTTAQIGFTLSPGKNYVHSRYLTVNSEGHDFNPKTGVLRKIGFLNVGLLIGQAKVTQREQARLSPLQGKYLEVMKGAHSKYRAHRRFVHYNLRTIVKMSDQGRFSLFVDPLLGGLGFELFPEVRPHVKFTPFQLGFASHLLSKVKRVVGPRDRLVSSYMGILAPRTSYVIGSHTSRSWGSYELRQRFRPLQEGEDYVLPLDPAVGGIMQRVHLNEVSEPSVRYPRKSLLREFTVARDHGLLTRVSPRTLTSLSKDNWWVRTHDVMGKQAGEDPELVLGTSQALFN